MTTAEEAAAGGNQDPAAASATGDVTLTSPVASEGGGRPPAVAPSSLNSVPRATLACRPNSHPFQDRALALDQSCKVGRSVARARPASTNAIFDCKVLSRNHALLWYEGGKFFLQDTKSSNGTFVNNQRLSKGSEESLPREVCSGDILQFGVDVMENSRKVTHGCIIATLRLYLPDGKEAKASPTIITGLSSSASSSPFAVSGSGTSLPPQDLYLLNQHIQEALVREQLLETKLAVLQRIVGQTEAASGRAWKALIDEDRLLARVEILEGQLSAYAKNMSEDKLREEAQRLMEEKEEYQEIAKETLTNMVNEKLEAVRRAGELEKRLHAADDEKAALRELYEQSTEENQRLAKQFAEAAAKLNEAEQETDKLKKKKEEGEEEEQKQLKDKSEVTKNAGDSETDQTKQSKSDCEDDVRLQYEAKTVEIAMLQERCSLLESENGELKARFEALDIIGRTDSKETKEDVVEVAPDAAVRTDENENLKDMLETLQYENSELRSDLDRLLREKKEEAADEQKPEDNNLSESRGRDENDVYSEANSDLNMSHLLRAKEKYSEVLQENMVLETSLRELEEEVGMLSTQSRAATALALLPLFLLLLAFFTAYLPFWSAVFATAEPSQMQ